MRIRTFVLSVILGSIALAAPRGFVELFRGTFDAPGAVAEVGQFVAFSNTGSIAIAPSANGGNKLVFDDSGTSGSNTLYLVGTFDNNQLASVGLVSFTFEMTLSDSDSPFQAGVVIDNATSDFIPATGPDGEGGHFLGGKKTRGAISSGQELDVTVQLSRDSTEDDWQLDVSIAPSQIESPTQTPVAHPAAMVESTMLAGTGGTNIVGIAFVKLPGNTGSISLDNIHVVNQK